MDYDVEAVALATPPAAASLTTYRPAISVRNNGTHPAIATGNLQAYMAGLLVWSSSVESGTIAPGATGLASALTEWKPKVQGDYMLFGYVTTLRDQYEPNNQLAPVKIHVGPEPPVPPPTVPAHVEQHESGGSDELFVEGLQGQLADDQPTLPHAAKHQAAGEDQLNVSGLSGVLGEPQQPLDHGNESHTTPFASSAELTAHQNATSVHTAALNLANRELSGALTGLVPSTQIANLTEFPGNPRQALLSGRGWGYPRQAALGSNLGPTLLSSSSGTAVLGQLLIPEAWLSDDMQLIFSFWGRLSCVAAAGALLELSAALGTATFAGLVIDCEEERDINLLVSGAAIGAATGKVVGNMTLTGEILLETPTPLNLVYQGGLTPSRPAGAQSLILTAEFTLTTPGTSLQIYSGYIRALHPIP